MVLLQNNLEIQRQRSLNCKSHLKAVHVSQFACVAATLSEHLPCESERVGEATVSLFNHPPGPQPPTAASESHSAFPFKKGLRKRINGSGSAGQLSSARLGSGAQARGRKSLMASVIQPTMRASKRHKQGGRRRRVRERETTTRNEMSNKEYENVRGR